MKCPECKGDGVVVGPVENRNHEDVFICTFCGGDGTVALVEPKHDPKKHNA